MVHGMGMACHPRLHPPLPTASQHLLPDAPCLLLRRRPRPTLTLPAPPSRAALQATHPSEGLTNAVVASAAGHPFWPYVFEVMRERGGGGGPIHATGAPGPVLLGRRSPAATALLPACRACRSIAHCLCSTRVRACLARCRPRRRHRVPDSAEDCGAAAAARRCECRLGAALERRARVGCGPRLSARHCLSSQRRPVSHGRACPAPPPPPPAGGIWQTNPFIGSWHWNDTTLEVYPTGG